MKTLGVPFTEQLSPLDLATNSVHFWEFSPTKKVPVLVDGDTTIWDSLAILEYVAERFSDLPWWPSDRVTRGVARSVAQEMHSGFPALRDECPMNMQRAPAAIAVSDACRVDIDRIETMMQRCYDGHDGDFLFDQFCIADAMLAPVANRVRVYELSEHPAVMKFCDSVEALPAWRQWAHEAAEEPWVCDAVEI